MAAQRAIRLRAYAQALMEQADLATYRAVMAASIFDAISNASTSQAAPNSIPDYDVILFAEILLIYKRNNKFNNLYNLFMKFTIYPNR